MVCSKSSSPDQLKMVLNYLKYSGVSFSRDLSVSDRYNNQKLGTNDTNNPFSPLTKERQ